MKTTLEVGIAALLILGFVAASCLASENIADVNRYFYHGDGRLNLVSAKNGITFNGQYRKSKGIYDEKALKTIQRLFGGQNGKPLSTISLRLIEFLDYLEDNLHFPDGEARNTIPIFAKRENLLQRQVSINTGWRRT
jgi:hypothetical protein